MGRDGTWGRQRLARMRYWSFACVAHLRHQGGGREGGAHTHICTCICMAWRDGRKHGRGVSFLAL
eukprot:39670-Chlamydomonas_euryale.AAC.1